MNDPYQVPPPAFPTVQASAPDYSSWTPPPASKPARSIAGFVLLIMVFVFGIAIGSSGALGRSAGPGANGSGTGSTATPRSGSSAAPGASGVPDQVDTNLLEEALAVINKNFVGRSQLDSKTLTYGAIRGMVQALGDTAHSVFLTPEQAKAEQSALDQNVVGIGVLLGEKDGQTVVVSVVPNSPAQQAGLKAGDQIVTVNGQTTQGLTPDQLVQQVRGDEGSQVMVTVERPSTGERLDFNITRQKIKFPSVSWTMVPGTDIALIRFAQFAAGSADELIAARDEALAAGATAIILDLRGNPGGYVDQATKSASAFLPHVTTVYIRELADGSHIPVTTDNTVTPTDAPLVVLVDNNTASSAEIMSGALKSAGRAPIVGETTFGTGTVLLPFTLSDGSVIRLAIERWLTPDAELIFGKGITPTDPVTLGPGDVPIEPADLSSMTPDQLNTITDLQLIKAIQLLGGPTIKDVPTPAPAGSSAP